jgi:hypothetical protein
MAKLNISDTGPFDVDIEDDFDEDTEPSLFIFEILQPCQMIEQQDSNEYLQKAI